jgi:hypothetical protein
MTMLSTFWYFSYWHTFSPKLLYRFPPPHQRQCQLYHQLPECRRSGVGVPVVREREVDELALPLRGRGGEVDDGVSMWCECEEGEGSEVPLAPRTSQGICSPVRLTPCSPWGGAWSINTRGEPTLDLHHHTSINSRVAQLYPVEDGE